MHANEIPPARVPSSSGGREDGGAAAVCLFARFELRIGSIWELSVPQHPSNLGFVSNFPQRQKERERGEREREAVR